MNVSHTATFFDLCLRFVPLIQLVPVGDHALLASQVWLCKVVVDWGTFIVVSFCCGGLLG